jgi:putative ABC transport system substrate-binding protein
MQRREFIVLLGGTAAAWPLVARAQQSAMPVIGFLGVNSASEWQTYVAAFQKGLGEAGLLEGQNVRIKYLWAEGRYDRIPALAADLVQRQVAVIAAAGTISARSAKAATSTIPIVFVSADDPVDNGLVSSLNRPGGNVTGASMVSAELRPKMLQLLYELAPQTKLIHMLANPNNNSIELQTQETKAAAEAAGLQFQLHKVATPGEIDAAFAKFSDQGGALLVASDPFLNARHIQIAALAARYAVPGVYPWREFVTDGGLMSYGSILADGYRQAGYYTGRILKGDKPADLPVLQPTRLELIINLKTAKTLGLTVPLPLLGRADEVIE